jgi:hypothetical protein
MNNRPSLSNPTEISGQVPGMRYYPADIFLAQLFSIVAGVGRIEIPSVWPAGADER